MTAMMMQFENTIETHRNISIPSNDMLIKESNQSTQHLKGSPDQSYSPRSLQFSHFCFTPTLSIQSRINNNPKRRTISSVRNRTFIPINPLNNSRAQVILNEAQKFSSLTNRCFTITAKEGNPSSGSSDIFDEDSEERKALDSVADTGEKRLEAIRSNVNEDLEQVCTDSEQLGSDLIEQGTVELLELYNDKRKEILDNVATDRDLIEEEVQKLDELTKARERSLGKETESPAYKITFAVTGLFTVGALFYTWNGFVDGDSIALQNAAVDAGAAAICAYFLSRSKNSK